MARRWLGWVLAGSVLASATAQAQADTVPTIAEVIGTPIGTDYFLANYDQAETYFKAVAARSQRAKLVEIGRTAENRPQYMMIVSSPANLARLDRYRAIATKLARGTASAAEAKALAAEGKAVVWIDGGMHAAETVHAQALMAAIEHFTRADDDETRRILDNVVILFGHDNPDGQQLVADWYMGFKMPRPVQPTQGGALPKLYQKYVGHDNNRDWYAVTQPETINVSRILFRDWYPQIIYNHHQPGPDGMVVFMPPFRDPYNYNYDPLIVSELSEVGAALHSGLIAEGKAGSGMRTTANYSTWFNGSLRTVSYFHNAIGILTEIVGSPTPFQLPMTAANQLPRTDLPMPVAPRIWHMKDSIEYSTSMNRALLDYAARNRERLLLNSWTMASNAIARGSKDSWTTTAADVEALEAAAKAMGKGAGTLGLDPRANPAGVDVNLYAKVLRDPAKRDARGYILRADQPDFPTAVKFANALIRSGVEVERATTGFTVAGTSYPAGSLVVKTAQAYRPHVLDMFEPQHHPHDTAYPGGPPVRPYDATGYTLAYQMGVAFDRVVDGFDGPFAKVAGEIAPPPGKVIGTGTAGWLIDHRANDAFVLTNRLLKAGVKVAWLAQGATTDDGVALGAGAIWVPASPAAARIVAAAVGPLGLDAYGSAAAPAGDQLVLKQPRIGVVDIWGGLMPAGWVRWLFDQFEFPYTIVHPQRLDKGDLARDFDVLVMADAAWVDARNESRNRRPISQPKPEEIPAQYRGWLGTITAEKTVPQLVAFAKAGGTLMTIGSSTALVEGFDLPISPALRTAEGKPLPDTQFYVPGSVLTTRVDPRQPLGYGMGERADVYYDNSPVYRVASGTPGVSPVAWFEGATLLRSGWALGEAKLDGAAGVLDVSVGRGKLLMYGPEVLQRGQPHGTFKLFFNGVLYGPAARR